MFFIGIFTSVKPHSFTFPIAAILSPFIGWFVQSQTPKWFGGYQIGFEILLINGAIMALLLYAGSFFNSKEKLSLVE